MHALSMVKSSQHIMTQLLMYKYYNLNPQDRALPDCVCRAISLATRTDYNCVLDMLFDNGVCYSCDELTIDCYGKMLNGLGYKAVEVKDKKVSDICSEFPDNIVLIRIEGHLTCSVNGTCYDIWDCTDREVDKYWLIS